MALLKKYLLKRQLRREEAIKNVLVSLGGKYHLYNDTMWCVKYDPPLFVNNFKCSVLYKVRKALHNMFFDFPKINETHKDGMLISTIIYDRSNPKSLLFVYKSPYTLPEGVVYAPLIQQ